MCNPTDDNDAVPTDDDDDAVASIDSADVEIKEIERVGWDKGSRRSDIYP